MPSRYAPSPHRPTALSVVWAAFLLALAFSPDAQLHRLKLLHIEWSLLAAAVVWALSGLKDGWVARRTALDLPVAASGLLALAFYAAAPEKDIAALELHRLLLGCGAFFIASQALESPELLAPAWSALAAVLSLWALWIRWSTGDVSRAMGSFGNPILFAAFLVPAVPLAVSIKPRTLGYGLAAVLLAGLWATGTRAAFVALAATGILALWLEGGGKAARVAGSLALLAAGTAAVLLVARPMTHALIWRDTVSLWLEHPLLGVGLGRFHLEFPGYASPALRSLWPQSQVVINHAHDELLQTLAETGLLGAGVLVWLWAAFARLPRGPLFWAAAALWLQSFLSPDMRFGVSYACVFVLMAAAAPATEELHLHLPAAARVAGAAFMTAAALALGLSVRNGALADRALQEPSFFGASPQVDAELQRWLDEAAHHPADPLVHENLGYYYAKKKDFPRAIAELEESVRLDPRRAGPWNNLGNIFYMEGNAAPALEAWKHALDADPGLVDTHLNLGIVYYTQGDLKSASRELHKTLELDPKNEKARALLRRMTE